VTIQELRYLLSKATAVPGDAPTSSANAAELARRDSPARSPGARYDFREHVDPLAVVKLFVRL
jgi:hypothetical protein